MAVLIKNNSATALGLWDTSVVYHTAGGLGGMMVIDPDSVGAEIIDILASTGDISVSEPEEPMNDEPPEITGDAIVDETLTASPGVWTGAPTPVITYQWQVSDDGIDGWADIEGETSNEYTVIADDEGKYIMCVVTATNSEGSDSAESNVIGPVVDPEV